MSLDGDEGGVVRTWRVCPGAWEGAVGRGVGVGRGCGRAGGGGRNVFGRLAIWSC